MKKSKKFLAYSLILTLLVTLMSGLGFKAVAVKAATKTFRVLEIVPHVSMGTFGLFVGSLSGEKNTDGTLKYANSYTADILTKGSPNNSSASGSRTFLKDQNLATFSGGNTSGSYISTDFFRQRILSQIDPDAEWKIEIETVTPNDVDATKLLKADFIIINQTVSDKLTGITRKTFDDTGCTFSTDTMMLIYKKIAGLLDGKAVPYIIDFSLYYKGGFVDVRPLNNPDVLEGEGGTNNIRMGFTPPDQVSIAELGEDKGATVIGANPYHYLGSDRNSYKLFKLLSCVDPATMYGLFFTENDGSYGLVEEYDEVSKQNELKQIYAPSTMEYKNGAYNIKSNVNSLNLNGKATAWDEALFNPWFLYTGSKDDINLGSDKSYGSMKWLAYVHRVWNTEGGTTFTKTPADFVEVVGSGVGNGIVYSSAQGLPYAFNYFNATPETPETPPEDPEDKDVTDLSEYVESASYYGNQWGGTLTVNLSSSGLPTTIKPWEIKVKPVGHTLSSYTYNSTYDKVSSVKDGDYIVIKSDKKGVGDVTSGLTWKLSCAVDFSDYHSTVNPGESFVFTRYIEEPSSGEPTSGESTSGESSSGESSATRKHGKLVDIIEAYNTNDTSKIYKVDFHPYRYLVVSKNTISSINRSVADKMVKAANDAGIGLAGGVIIDCMSANQFANISCNLMETYDGICFESGVSTIISGSSGASKYNSYTAGKPSFTSNALVAEFKKDLKNNVGIRFISTPVEYYNTYKASFAGENFGIYSVDGKLTSDNYITVNSTTKKKQLDFTFEIIGSGSYTVDLYIDSNHNDIFENTSDEKISFGSLSGNSIHTKSSGDLETYLGKDYAGGFAWKLVVSGGSRPISRLGFSAIRPAEGKQQVIKVLQVCPTDYSGSGSLFSQNDKQDSEEDDLTTESHPLLLLATSGEIARAKSKHGDNDITKYNVVTQLDTIKQYFDDSLNVKCATGFGSKSGEILVGEGDSQTTQTVTLNILNPSISGEYLKLSSETTEDRKGIVYNSSSLYYFLESLKDYKVETTRLSVIEFNKAIQNGTIGYNSKTKRFYQKNGTNGDPVLNQDGSQRYVFTYEQLGLPSNWKNETVSWPSYENPTPKKYLVDDITQKIYGYRTDVQGKVVYYGSTIEGLTANGTAVKSGDDFDLLVLGFGSSMDYMETNAVSKIETYLKNGGPALCGNGTVSRSKNNTLGHRISDELGMIEGEDGYTEGYHPGSEYDADASFMMVTNNTLFTHYPFVVNRILKGAGQSGIGPYKLDLSKSNLVCTYTKYCSANSAAANFKTWGYVKNNYYLYKIGNITYCQFGATRNAHVQGQLGGTMSPAESMVIVNALITSARNGSDDDADPPYIDCKDADRSVLDLSTKDGEDDETLTGGGKKKWILQDSIYTDYDSFGFVSTINNNKPIFSTSGSSTNPISTSKPANLSAGSGESTENIRWIPYLATITDNAYLRFSVTGMKVYKEVSTTSYQKIDETEGKGYLVSTPGMYYIGVPLTYNTSTGMGFKLTKDNSVDQFKFDMSLCDSDGTEKELHKIVMIRRVLYPVN